MIPRSLRNRSRNRSFDGRASGSGAIPVIAIIVGVAGLLVWGGYHIVATINFNRHCSGYLKNAADANTIDQAEERLAIAVKYIQDNELTSGFTSILWTTPSEDVGFWSRNLIDSLAELGTIPDEATQLEKSNVLMKLRETILDDGGSGQTVTIPSGISIFPHNVTAAWLGVIFFAMTAVGVLGLRSSSFSATEIVLALSIIILLCSVMSG